MIVRHFPVKRDTSVNWFNINPILNLGEIGYDLDKNQSKIGNGIKHWNELEFLLAGNTDLFEIQVETQELYPNNYKEVQYDPTTKFVAQVDQWDSPAKAIHLFSKVFTYDSQNRLTQEVSTKVNTGAVQTKVITYDSSNFIQTLTRSYQE